jgi:hypothetical protein
MQGDRTSPAAAAEDLTDLRRDIESMISGAASAAAGKAGRRLAVASRLPRELRDIRWQYAAGTLTGQLAAGRDPGEVHRVISALAAITRGQRATKRGRRGEELESCGYAGGMTVIICGVLPGSDGGAQCAASSWRGRATSRMARAAGITAAPEPAPTPSTSMASATRSSLSRNSRYCRETQASEDQIRAWQASPAR